MAKIRMSTCFEWTAEVPDGSTRAVQVQEAKDAMYFALPFRMDDEEFIDVRITGVTNVTSEVL